MNKQNNNLAYWDTLDGIGDLYIENELIVGVETLLFVCTNEQRGQRWLFMTYDSCNWEYVFVKISSDCLLKMLKNEITMESAFRQAEYIGETYIGKGGNMMFIKNTPDAFDGKKLPEKDVYYNVGTPYIMDYINTLREYINNN